MYSNSSKEITKDLQRKTNYSYYSNISIEIVKAKDINKTQSKNKTKVQIFFLFLVVVN